MSVTATLFIKRTSLVACKHHPINTDIHTLHAHAVTTVILAVLDMQLCMQML